MPIWLITAIASAVLAFGAGWQTHSWKTDAALLAQQQATDAAQQKTNRTTFRNQEARDAEMQRTGDLLADALGRLRNRPSTRLIQTPAACAGASPAALSSEDGAVALRLAAEADRLRADYVACRQWVDGVTGTLAP